MTRDASTVAGWLRAARRVCVLTGAGVSAESRVPTFRDAAESAPADMKALWAAFDPEALATAEAYARDPEMVSRWYDWRRLLCARAEPNPGHLALAEMERRIDAAGGAFTLLTQNVDGLHRRAGSRRVVELHGSIFAWRGISTGRPFELPDGPLDTFPPSFPDGEIARPGVVWFGEALPSDAIEAAADAAGSCDLFFAVGTSAVVYPAAGFAHAAASAGGRTVEINPSDTPISDAVDAALRGTAGEVLPALVSAWGED